MDFRTNHENTLNKDFHRNVIWANYPSIVAQLQMSPAIYRLLQEKGILPDQQIQIIQRECSQELKVAKLLSLLEGEGCWVLEPFFDLLNETGYVQLAKVLQSTALTKCQAKQEDSGNKSKLWNQMQTLEQELEKGYMEESLTLQRTLEDMKREYLLRLQDLENEFVFTERERDVARRERNMALQERELLLRQNKELLKTLKHVRQSLEQQENKWYGADQTSQALAYMVPMRNKWNLFPVVPAKLNIPFVFP
ncbi:uncharacterized protein LOC109930375 [Rhincodon typus]|uniref:uncharacterized protein LOC109930375 n=1 Tax=Rhincodon typus TaxID=259920 RepID=UPI00202E3E9C|nr:uncharacterized protein LOC109930375 [Rhincodon typus]XP_048472042.1 uncharacterized protein LOC109930375 [Rhincodon typus]XP_048472043.1 uncharacterized protein LOC109930375 [Rhincodon typus]